mgnify:CR=1 FL=1
MKKIICMIIVIFMLSSCGNADIGNDNDKLSVVCTVFPAYDWIREISAGTEISLYLIPSNGTDIHSYQPTAEDIIKITGCDLFVYSEGHEKGWYEDLSIKEKFNMSVFENHDEHVWLSLKCANELTEKLTEKLSKLNPENEERYNKNCKAYVQKLSALHDKYKATVEGSERKKIIVADRFPFSHMTDEYKIEAYSAFSGCSAESEVSFETIAFLSKKLSELKLTSVITTEDADEKIARAVISNSNNDNVKILSLNSMQAVTEKDISEGMNYLSVMSSNLLVLEEALN